MRNVHLLWSIGLICIVGSIAGGVFAQAPRSAEPADSLNELLAEVRGLRAEIKLASSASIRTQLLTARLQLQEQRVYTVGRQLTDVQELLGKVRAEMGIEEVQQQLADQIGKPPTVDDRLLRQQEAMDKLRFEQMQKRELQLRAQETELFNSLNAEQAHWTEFNGRLDEVERSLPTGAAR